MTEKGFLLFWVKVIPIRFII